MARQSRSPRTTLRLIPITPGREISEISEILPNSHRSPNKGDILADQERRTQEQRTGQHAGHEPIDRGFQSPVVQVDVELPALNLFENFHQVARQQFDEVLQLRVEAAAFSAALRPGDSRRRTICLR